MGCMHPLPSFQLQHHKWVSLKIMINMSSSNKPFHTCLQTLGDQSPSVKHAQTHHLLRLRPASDPPPKRTLFVQKPHLDTSIRAWPPGHRTTAQPRPYRRVLMAVRRRLYRTKVSMEAGRRPRGASPEGDAVGFGSDTESGPKAE